jgi:hypothetical protein
MNRHTPARLAFALAATALLALGACQQQPSSDQPPAGETMAPRDEWAGQNPTEPAVPVDLPTTPMTNVPPAEAAASPSPAAS